MYYMYLQMGPLTFGDPGRSLLQKHVYCNTRYHCDMYELLQRGSTSLQKASSNCHALEHYCIHKKSWQYELVVASSGIRGCNNQLPLATPPKSNATQENGCESGQLKQHKVTRQQYHISFATPSITNATPKCRGNTPNQLQNTQQNSCSNPNRLQPKSLHMATQKSHCIMATYYHHFKVSMQK